MILGALLIFFLMNLRLCSHIFYTHRFLEVFLRVVNILGVDPHQLCYLEPGSNLVPSGTGKNSTISSLFISKTRF